MLVSQKEALASCTSTLSAVAATDRRWLAVQVRPSARARARRTHSSAAVPSSAATHSAASGVDTHCSRLSRRR